MSPGHLTALDSQEYSGFSKRKRTYEFKPRLIYAPRRLEKIGYCLFVDVIFILIYRAAFRPPRSFEIVMGGNSMRFMGSGKKLGLLDMIAINSGISQVTSVRIMRVIPVSS